MPNTLIIDIETAPIEAYVWGLRDENIGVNQIKTDWRILSCAAKWRGRKGVIYLEARKPEDEKAVLVRLRGLLHLADIVIYQNGEKFDSPKINARLVAHGIRPPSPYLRADTCKIARKVFGFTSNKLEYLTERLCTKYKKLPHKNFPGFELWRECLKGNPAAWAEMKKYNIHDVLATEELYEKLQPWDSATSAVYEGACTCGSTDLESRGFAYTTVGRYRRYVCKQCGKWTKDGLNTLSKAERAALRRPAGPQ